MAHESMYVVWNPLGDNPQKRHESLPIARGEADRLAAAHPDTEFFILRCCESVKHLTTPVVRKTFSKKG